MNISMTSNLYRQNTLNIKDDNFNPKSFMSANLNERDIEILKEIFDMFDSSKKGYLNPQDLKTALQMFDFYPPRELIYQMFSNIDSEELGIINFSIFTRIMADILRPCDEDKEDEYLGVFNYFTDGKDFITKDDIMRVSTESGEKLDEEELKLIMDKLDVKDNNKIYFPKFYKSLKEATFINNLNK